jgi:hypothetical protein
MADTVNFQREEVRGLFVIGIIASLLAVRDVLRLKVALPFGITLDASVLNILLFFWALYAFLMAIAVSDDIFAERIRAECFDLSRFSFLMGIFLVLWLLMLAVLAPLFVTIAGAELGQSLALVCSILFSFYMLNKITPKRRDDGRGPVNNARS